MFISFYNVIFDPADLLCAQALPWALSLQIRGTDKVLMIPCVHETESGNKVDRSNEIFAELVDILTAQELMTGEEPEISDDLYEALMDLHNKGYAWVARDRDGKMYAYLGKPEKDGAYWADLHPDQTIQLINPLYDDLDGEDKALNIMELILGK